MADPVTLVILLAAGEASGPAAVAMAQGAHDAFAGVVTELHEIAKGPTDADALAAEGQSHPDAVAELLWRDADRRHATLRVHLRQSHRWIERSFAFAASDPIAERGRTLGFAVASILPELFAPSSLATPPPSAGAPSPSTPPASIGPPAGATASASEAPGPPGSPGSFTATVPTANATVSSAPAPAPSPPAAPGRAPNAPSEPPSEPPAAPASSAPRTVEDARPESAEGASLRNPVLALDLLGIGVSAIPSNANAAGGGGVGGGGAIEWFVHRRLSLRLGASGRAGSLDAAQANVQTLLTSAGAVFQALPATRSEPFSVSVRIDYVLVRQSATHYDGDESSAVNAARWVSGFDSFVDGSLLLSSQIAAVVGFGLEDVLAPTYVYLKDVRVATLPPLRAVVEGGFQLKF